MYFVKEMLEDKGESFEVRRQALAPEPLLRAYCVEGIWMAPLSLLCLMRLSYVSQQDAAARLAKLGRIALGISWRMATSSH